MALALMTSTTTPTTSSTRIGLLGILKSKQTNPWPNPRSSIGDSWCTLGKNRCWEPVGPGQEIVGKVFGSIKNLLESQHEYLNEGVSIPRAILFSLYMIGRTEDDARPTIIFSCENKAPRQRAVKIVRASKLLDDYAGVGLGESQRPLILSRSPIRLGDQNPDENMQTSDGVSVYYLPPLTDLYGIPIGIRNAEDGRSLPLRKATVGGFIYVGKEVVGVTVAHVFQEDPLVPQSLENDAMEYSLEFENEDDTEDEDLAEITSRGSISAEESVQDDSASSQVSEYFKLLPPLPIGKRKENSIQDEMMEANKSFFGRMAYMSEDTSTNNLDWALIKLDCQDVLSSVSRSSQFGLVQSFVKSMPARAEVQANTGSSGIMRGTIFGIPTFMQQPPNVAFQEMWTVRLNGVLQLGDCGSWVTDLDGKVLYGYIVAGDPGTSIGYIIPAYQAFSDMEGRLGATVTFLSRENCSEKDQGGPNAPELPNTDYKLGWRDRIRPDGNREVEWRREVKWRQPQERLEYEESAETESTCW